jgi:hypothetical protein
VAAEAAILSDKDRVQPRLADSRAPSSFKQVTVLRRVTQ